MIHVYVINLKEVILWTQINSCSLNVQTTVSPSVEQEEFKKNAWRKNRQATEITTSGFYLCRAAAFPLREDKIFLRNVCMFQQKSIFTHIKEYCGNFICMFSFKKWFIVPTRAHVRHKTCQIAMETIRNVVVMLVPLLAPVVNSLSKSVKMWSIIQGCIKARAVRIREALKFLYKEECCMSCSLNGGYRTCFLVVALTWLISSSLSDFLEKTEDLTIYIILSFKNIINN